MSKKKILAVVIAAFAALFVLTGCLTKEQKQNLRDTESLAEGYLENKYHKNFSLKDSGYVTYNSSVFMEYSSNMWFEFSDGTNVYYDAENDEGKSAFYDDRQSQEISDAIVNDILFPVFQEIGDVRIGASDNSVYSAFKFNNIYNDWSLFHEYYNGSIKDYLNKEKVSASTDENIYIVCNENEWETAFDICKRKLLRYLRVNGFINFLAVTEQGYREQVSQHYEDGMFSKLHCNVYGTNLYIQKYIQVAENIYICADDEDGFVLNDGDIVFEPVEGFGEFAGKKAYKPVFSDIVKSKCKYNDEYKCLIKLGNNSNVDECELYKYIPEYDKSYVVTRSSNIVRLNLNEEHIYWFGKKEMETSMVTKAE